MRSVSTQLPQPTQWHRPPVARSANYKCLSGRGGRGPGSPVIDGGRRLVGGPIAGRTTPGPGRPDRYDRPTDPLPPPVDACVTEIAASVADAGCGTACDGGRCRSARSGHHDNAHRHTRFTCKRAAICGVGAMSRQFDFFLHRQLQQHSASDHASPCHSERKPQCLTNVQLFI